MISNKFPYNSNECDLLHRFQGRTYVSKKRPEQVVIPHKDLPYKLTVDFSGERSKLSLLKEKLDVVIGFVSNYFEDEGIVLDEVERGIIEEFKKEYSDPSDYRGGLDKIKSDFKFAQAINRIEMSLK